ncbi:MAG: hypothetical protein PHI63_02620 [Patescibacteria group bacterium]|nr:hypothetical protein [Patescibacteria group bacterium]
MSAKIVLVTNVTHNALRVLRRGIQEGKHHVAFVHHPVTASNFDAAFWVHQHAAPDPYEPVIVVGYITPCGSCSVPVGASPTKLVYAQLVGGVHCLVNDPAVLALVGSDSLRQAGYVGYNPYHWTADVAEQVRSILATGGPSKATEVSVAIPLLATPVVLHVGEFNSVTMWAHPQACDTGAAVAVQIARQPVLQVPFRKGHLGGRDDLAELAVRNGGNDEHLLDLWVHPRARWGERQASDVIADIKPGDAVTITPAA